MNDFLSVLKRAAIFGGIDKDEMTSLLGCLGATTQTYEKNEYILRPGESPESVGLLLTGSILLCRKTSGVIEISVPILCRARHLPSPTPAFPERLWT